MVWGPFVTLSAQQTAKPAVEEKSDTVYTLVDRKAAFPGGSVAWDNFIAKNLKYPKVAKNAGVQTAVIVRFIVRKDGSVTQPEFICSTHPQFTDEVNRLIKLMPKWTPAKREGKVCDSYVKQPFIFQLKETPTDKAMKRLRAKYK